MTVEVCGPCLWLRGVNVLAAAGGLRVYRSFCRSIVLPDLARMVCHFCEARTGAWYVSRKAMGAFLPLKEVSFTCALGLPVIWHNGFELGELGDVVLMDPIVEADEFSRPAPQDECVLVVLN